MQKFERFPAMLFMPGKRCEPIWWTFPVVSNCPDNSLLGA
jgi:hypothetical protein